NTTGGSIIEWDPATNILIKKIDLNQVRGSSASGTLLLSGTKMFGLTKSGGADNLGTLFEWDPSTNIFTKRADLGGKDDKFPTGTLTPANGKLYGACTNGGTNGIGLLFEWDPSTSTYTKKYNFSVQDGRNPNSSLTYFNNKFYGMTTFGGTQDAGVIFEWDPATNTYTKKIDFTAATGTTPYGDLVAYNNKLYGITTTGNAGNTGTIFEWDPFTNIIIKKVDFTGPTGYHAFGSLALYNNKFYGTTLDGGPFPNFSGTIFEWDPATNIIAKKIDFSPANGYASYGTMTLVNNLFYGVTYFGGANGAGVLFEYDPSTNVYTIKNNFVIATGSNPQAGLTYSNGKLYGITRNGGSNGRGVIFEWNPTTNSYSKKYDFSNFSAKLYYNNNLLNVPAFVGNGIANTCSTMPSITINSSNNNIWVPITDSKGDAIGEINANGNNLGLVTTSVYINNGPVREDAQHRLYLDRNLSITPQVQPSTAVDIRLYLKKSEFDALRTAVNSLGQPSGVNTIADLQLFKNSDSCSAVIVNATNPTPVTAAQWGDNYVLSASISSFSSFYVAKTNTTLPVTLTRFSGTVAELDALLSWTTITEQDMAGYEVERSLNGTNFAKVGNRVDALNSTSAQDYQFRDPQIFDTQKGNVYYRLKMINIDGGVTYSGIIVLSLNGNSGVKISPNPANNEITVDLLNDTRWIGKAVSVTDIQGKKVISMLVSSQKMKIDISRLQAGMYFIELKKDNGERVKLRFIKL
ncbi:MAG: T9SS type A sorting domain-containing protein, partial [Chitinophagaceae bacterium]|nr:T9SS type A sorting domain-containing protein [Chitinophagaceae bacterium]